jgi:hypothetical protein
MQEPLSSVALHSSMQEPLSSEVLSASMQEPLCAVVLNFFRGIEFFNAGAALCSGIEFLLWY